MVFDQKTKFIGAIAIQLIAIFSIVFFKLLILGNGTEILLHVTPVDPRDYLRGDYVSVQYDISSIRKYNFDYSPVNIGDVVYVPLKKSGQYWINTGLLERATKTKPKNGMIYIRGTVINGGKISGSNNWSVNNDLYMLKYGIEQKFIPVGTGTNVNFRDHEISATVHVGDSGEAVLKKLFVDGKEWPEKSK